MLSFSAPQPTVSHEEILKRVGLEDLACAESCVPEGEWPETTLHYYRSGVSCRAVEISRGEVRILACSCPEDYDLAFRFLAAFGAPAPAVDIPAQIRADLAALKAQSQILTLDGPIREFHIGPRLWSEIGDNPDRLFAAMRRTQYVNVSEYYAANVIPVDAPEPFTVAAWTEGVRTLFPAVDYIVLENTLFMPASVLPEVAGDRFQWLDEKQSLVEAFEGEDWKRLLKRVEAMRRPWWKFWSHSKTS